MFNNIFNKKQVYDAQKEIYADEKLISFLKDEIKYRKQDIKRYKDTAEFRRSNGLDDTTMKIAIREQEFIIADFENNIKRLKLRISFNNLRG